MPRVLLDEIKQDCTVNQGSAVEALIGFADTVLLAMLLQSGREPSRDSESWRNLQQMALALADFRLTLASASDNRAELLSAGLQRIFAAVQHSPR